MDLQITGTVNSVRVVKSGTSFKGGKTTPWTIYEVIIEGQKFQTFDSTYQTMIGQNGTFDYTVTSRQGNNGQTYQNNTLKSLAKKAGGNSALGQEMNAKLDRIISMLQAMGTAQASTMSDEPVGQPTDEINVDDIPF